jgi:hypothetical protein
MELVGDQNIYIIIKEREKMDKEFKDKLYKIGFNVDQSVNYYFLNSEDYFEKILKKYLIEDDIMEQALKCIEQNDCIGAFNATHKLKAQLGYFCYDSLCEKVKLSCEYFRHNDFDQGKRLLKSCEEEYYYLVDILKNHYCN